MGRFLNADSYPTTGQGLMGNNMFAYCGNEPVARVDQGGTAWETVWDIISLASSVAEVATNPTDIWAWAGLVGDVADVLIPCVGGLGEAVDAVKVARKAADAADTVGDVATGAGKGWKAGECVANFTKADNIPSWSTIRNRYWKNKAKMIDDGVIEMDYLDGSLELMRKGRAPFVELNGERYRMELHHPNGRQGKNIFIFQEVTPWDHAAIDNHRFFIS